MDSIVPDLAESWAWSADNKTLTFKLRQGVKWHDGKPFTSADVKCTFDMLMGKSPQKFRQNPRKSWYDQVNDVTTNGDYEASFNLKRPQPSLLALLASGYTPVYPCHVSPAEMRTHPIGTGPFKFVEFKANEFDQAGPQRGLLQEGPAAPRRHRVHHHPEPFDRDPRFCRRQVRHDVSDRDNGPAVQGHQVAGAERGMRVRTEQCRDQHHRQLVLAAVRQSRTFAARMALALDRKAFISIMFEGQADIGGTMLPAPARLVGDAEGNAGDDSGLRSRRGGQPAGGAQADAEGGLRPGQAPAGQGIDPQHCRSTATRPSS